MNDTKARLGKHVLTVALALRGTPGRRHDLRPLGLVGMSEVSENLGDQPGSGKRFLSGTEKLATLESWFQRLTEMAWCPRDSVGGHGEPDADIVSWCLRLNRLSGVCTVQSCAGHRKDRFLSGGHLWLRLDERMSAAFDTRAHELAEHVESVARRYMPDGQLVVEVTFQGNERGRLSASMDRICSFFERLHDLEPS